MTRLDGRSRRQGISYLLGMGPLLILLALLIVLPLGMLLYASFVDSPPNPGAAIGKPTWQNFSFLGTSAGRDAVRNSLVIGVGGTALATVFGASLAWLAARSDIPLRPLVYLAGVLPLFIDSLVGTLAWTVLAAPTSGFINLVLADLGIPWTLNIYSVGGIVFVLALYYAPFIFLLVHSALVLVDSQLEEAALVAGASSFRVVRAITFPVVAPALIGSMLLCFMLTLENFPVPEILGTPARVNSLPTVIFQFMSSSPARANEAAALGTVLTLFMLLLLFAYTRFIQRRDYATVTGKGLRIRRTRLAAWRWVALSYSALYTLLSVVLPIAALCIVSMRVDRYISSASELLGGNWSLGRVSEMLAEPDFRKATYNSLLAALVAAVLGAALYLWISYVRYRTSLRGRKVLEQISMLPLAMPALVLGLGYLWTWIRLPLPLYGTLMILSLAFVSRFAPQGVRSVSASINQISPDLEAAARVGGAGRVRSVLEITVPLMRTGLGATMLLVFVLSIRELSVAIFLYSPDSIVLSILVFNKWVGGSFADAATISLLYSMLLLFITLAGRRWLEGAERA